MKDYKTLQLDTDRYVTGKSYAIHGELSLEENKDLNVFNDIRL